MLRKASLFVVSREDFRCPTKLGETEFSCWKAWAAVVDGCFRVFCWWRKIYFSALVDCSDGKIVRATTSCHPSQQLADDCLAQAIENAAPADPTILVIHSDRGRRYRGNNWIQGSQDIGFACSKKSKKGCWPDNLVCEGLFGRMKNEMFYGCKWRHREELEKAIYEYVDCYN